MYVSAIFFDVLTLAVSVALLVMSLWLWKFLRGGIMAKPWKVVIAMSVFLLASSVVCLAEMLNEAGEWALTLHEAIDFIALVLITYAVYVTYRTWSELGKGKASFS